MFGEQVLPKDIFYRMLANVIDWVFFMETNGWVKLHRSFLKWEWYGNVNTKVLFLHLIISANHEDAKWQGITIKRGQLITSVAKLAKEVGLTVRCTRVALSHLKMTNEVTNQSTSSYTILTLQNYEVYQESDKPNDKRVTNQRQTSDNKQECKNEKNITVLNTVHKSKDLRVDAIIEMFKTKFNKLPVDKKPRFIAYTFSKAILTFISKVEDVRPDLTYEVMVDKAFGYYISKYPDIQPEYIDTVYRYAKQLLAAQLLKIKPQTL